MEILLVRLRMQEPILVWFLYQSANKSVPQVTSMEEKTFQRSLELGRKM